MASEMPGAALGEDVMSFVLGGDVRLSFDGRLRRAGFSTGVFFDPVTDRSSGNPFVVWVGPFAADLSV